MSFWSWLTGRDDVKEKSVVANFPLVEQVSTELKTIGTTGVGNAQDAVYSALNALNNVKGMQYVGSITVSNYDSVFSSVQEMITGVADQLEGKANDIKTYQESSWLEKAGSTFCMGAAKIGEGLLSVVEDLGDGIVSVVGWGAGKLGATEFQKDCVNFINKEWSHDALNFYYESDFAKKSAITEDSLAAGAFKVIGKVGGYIAAGYLASGAMGLEAGKAVGVGVLKATGVTWGGTVVAGIATMGTSMETSIREALRTGQEFDYDAAMGKAAGDGIKAAALSFAMGKGAEKLSGAIQNKLASRAAAKAANYFDEAATGTKKTTEALAIIADKTDEGMAGAKKTAEVAEELTKNTAEAAEEVAKRGFVSRVLDGAKALPGKAVNGIKNLPANTAAALQHSAQTIVANGLPQVTAQGVATAIVPTALNSADTRLTDFEVDAVQVSGQTFDASGKTKAEIDYQAEHGPNPQNNSLFREAELAQVVKPETLLDQTPTDLDPKAETPSGGGPSGRSPSTPTTVSTVAPTSMPSTPTTVAPTVAPSTVSPTTISPSTTSIITPSPQDTTETPTSQTPVSHAGGGYNEQGYSGGNENTNLAASLSDLLDDSESSIDDIIKGSKYSRIPTTSKPLLSTDKDGSTSVIPLAAGMSVASAAGLAAKAYIDRKKASEEDEDDEEGEDYEYGQYDDINVDNWSATDDDIAAAQMEIGEDEFVNVDRQDDDEYYRTTDSPLSPTGLDELEEF